MNTARPFVIFEYGAADGGISADIMRNCITWIRAKWPVDNAFPMMLFYEDRFDNDFGSLFKNVEKFNDLPEENFRNIFAFASGTSFYSKCAPSNYVNFGFSSTALHWLSRKYV